MSLGVPLHDALRATDAVLYVTLSFGSQAAVPHQIDPGRRE
jgi:hypothetical protein